MNFMRKTHRTVFYEKQNVLIYQKQFSFNLLLKSLNILFIMHHTVHHYLKNVFKKAKVK